MHRPHRAGKYSVDIAGFEEFLHEVPVFSRGSKLIVRDEIGKMECISPLFRKTILHILDSDRMFIDTIAENGPPFIDRIRCRRDVLPVEITRENRDSLHRDIIARAWNLLEPPS